MTRDKLTFMPAFFDTYISKVPDNIDFVTLLKEETTILRKIEDKLQAQENHKYAEDKWTIKQLLQHLIDAERILCFRALCIARGEKNKILGFDEDAYAQTASVDHRTVADLLHEFEVNRQSTILMFSTILPENLHLVGNCNGVDITPLALGIAIVGHVRHHLQVIEDRYFKV